MLLGRLVRSVDRDASIGDDQHPPLAVEAHLVRLGRDGELGVGGGVAADRAAGEAEGQRQVGGTAVRPVRILDLAVDALHIAAEQADLRGVVDPRVEVRPALIVRLMPPGGAGELAGLRHQARDVAPGHQVQAPDGALVEQRAGEAQIVAIEEVLGDQHRAVGELIGERQVRLPFRRFAPVASRRSHPYPPPSASRVTP
jgi:hypothetical protein